MGWIPKRKEQEKNARNLLYSFSLTPSTLVTSTNQQTHPGIPRAIPNRGSRSNVLQFGEKRAIQRDCEIRTAIAVTDRLQFLTATRGGRQVEKKIYLIVFHKSLWQ
ncbi:hypothetical protein CDAR_69311 [Caerostris darwini]|uniref:Ycf15 n=1 Tax=Caerostris darwini TaxID=1538125 RepID=A0AAV4U0K5_9ARAC|nr:hypothetical protein CDAR_69311 [Caerostris darwini]